MSQLGEFLSNVYQQHVEEDKQRARKFKALVEYADTAGIMPKDRAMVMDVDSLEGAVQGHAAQQKAQELAAKLQDYASQADERAAMTKYREHAAAVADRQTALADQQQSALTGFARDFVTGNPAALARTLMPMDTAPVGQAFSGFTPDNLDALAQSVTPDNRMRYAMGNNPGAFAAPQFDNSLGVLQRYGGGDTETPRVTTLKTSFGELPVVSLPGSKAFQIDPRVGIDSKLETAKELADYRQKLHMQLLASGFSQAKDSETGEEITGYYIGPKGQSVDARTKIEQAGFSLQVGKDGTFKLVPASKAGAKTAPGTLPKHGEARNGYKYIGPDNSKTGAANKDNWVKE